MDLMLEADKAEAPPFISCYYFCPTASHLKEMAPPQPLRTGPFSDSSTLVASQAPRQSDDQTTITRKPTRELLGIFIPVSTSHSLEATLLIPDPKAVPDANKLAILTHPWSWLGGTMDDPVLRDISKLFLRKDYYVVLYNSSGVGLSDGRASFSGATEILDLQGVIDWALNEVTNVETLVLLGYSYGSLITSCCPSPAISQPSIKRLSYILLSHALGPVSLLTLFNSARYTQALDTLLTSSSASVLCIFGDRDQFTGIGRYNAWVERLKETIRKSSQDNTDNSPRKHEAFQAAVVQGADHFWRGDGRREMKGILADWLALLDGDVLQM